MIFGADNTRGPRHLDFLFDAFDGWRSASMHQVVFDASCPGPRCRAAMATTGARSPSSAATRTNLFEQCCSQFDSQRGGNRPFTLQQSLLLYAVLLHLITKPRTSREAPCR